MPRALLVCGSLQRASANRAALDVARAKLAACGAEAISFDDLASIPPLDPDRADDPGAAVTALRAQIAAADAVLLAAPEYAGAIAGVVKNALDWIVGSGELYGKPVALVSAGTTGGVFARRDLVRTLSWQGAHVVASLGIEGPQMKSTRDERGSYVFTDAATIDAIGALVSALVASVAESPRTRFEAMKPLLHDAGVDESPIAVQMAANEDGAT